jgi:mRNA-degrading endonuclease toxin of MazEF toxin-antitoxin module
LVLPDAKNGLLLPTQFQTDKISTMQRSKCRQVVGRLDGESMAEISMRLAVVLGLTE